MRCVFVGWDVYLDVFLGTVGLREGVINWRSEPFGWLCRGACCEQDFGFVLEVQVWCNVHL